jgi:hypothetical protein
MNKPIITKRQWLISLIGLGVMLIALIIFTTALIIESIVQKNGKLVPAIVIDNSELCIHKKRYLKVSVGEKAKIFNLKVYGRECRESEFKLGLVIWVRQNAKGNIVALPENISDGQILFFIGFIGILSFTFLKAFRSFNQKPIHQPNK